MSMCIKPTYTYCLRQVPGMSRRRLTACSGHPSSEYLTQLECSDAAVLTKPRHDSTSTRDEAANRRGKLRKRRLRTKSANDEQSLAGDADDSLRLSVCFDADDVSHDTVNSPTSPHSPAPTRPAGV